ncbi:MAG: molybdopterin dinucleotide binding domain-containing protein, partial [Halioglobus sp.]
KEISQATRGLAYGKRQMGTLRATHKATGQRIDAAPSALIDYLQQRLKRARQVSTTYPLHLISRRRRQTMNSWYAEITADKTRGSTGDWVEVHSSVGKALNLTHGDSVRVVSATTEILARLRLSDDVKFNIAVMEQGWGSRVFDPASGKGKAIGVNRNLLVANDETDPLSGVPRLNGTPVRIEAVVRESRDGAKQTRWP